MSYKFVVTTNAFFLNTNNPIIMVDGTVPNYQFKECDLHFDHHKEGGAPIQLDEMSHYLCDLHNGDVTLQGNTTFVTTMVDADAQCAAAAIILSSMSVHPWDNEWKARMSAIAYDCDHLAVADYLAKYADFAAKAVATLKQKAFDYAKELGYPANRREWTDEQRLHYASTSFQQGVEWLVDAAMGKRPWPGESGESDQYFANLERHVSEYRDRVSLTTIDGEHYLTFDFKGVTEYVDPRVPLKIAAMKWDTNKLMPQTVTVRDRNDGKGLSYTIGVVPLHRHVYTVDYTKSTFAALTQAERTKDPNWDIDGNGWGGRATVGGSSWNSGSLLEPHEVVEVIHNSNK